MTFANVLAAIIQDAFWSALACAGFMMIFNVPPRYLPYGALCAALGHALRTLLMQQFSIPIEFASIAGAALVGFLAMTFAQRYSTPSAVFSFPGVIPMVPGSFAYRAMIGLVSVASASTEQSSELLIQASANFVRTGLILGALSVGLALPALLFQREKPVV